LDGFWLGQDGVSPPIKVIVAILSAFADRITLATVLQKAPVNRAALLGGFSDVIKAARTPGTHVSNQEASRLGKALEKPMTC
jgi:hypothetical protein